MTSLLILIYMYLGFYWAYGQSFHKISWLKLFSNILFWPAYVMKEFIFYLKSEMIL